MEEHLEVPIPTLVCIRTDHLTRSSIIQTLHLVTFLVDPIRRLLHPLHPHKAYLGHPLEQEHKEQLEMHLLAVDLVSHSTIKFSLRTALELLSKHLCILYFK